MLPLVTTWMKLEGIMLSEIIPIEKDKYCMISIIYGIKNTKIKYLTQKKGSNLWLGEWREALEDGGQKG